MDSILFDARKGGEVGKVLYGNITLLRSVEGKGLKGGYIRQEVMSEMLFPAVIRTSRFVNLSTPSMDSTLVPDISDS